MIDELNLIQMPVQPERTDESLNTERYVWDAYVYKKDLTLIHGANGTGKSALCVRAASDVSLSKQTADDPNSESCKVLYLFAEQDLSNLAYSIQLCGGNLNNIWFYPTNCICDYALLGHQSTMLRQTVMSLKPQLIIIDPWDAYLDSDVQLTSEYVRNIMKELHDICKRNDCSMLLTSNVSKHVFELTDASDAPFRALCACCSSVLRTVQNYTDDDSFLLVHEKDIYDLPTEGAVFSATTGYASWEPDKCYSHGVDPHKSYWEYEAHSALYEKMKQDWEDIVR